MFRTQISRIPPSSRHILLTLASFSGSTEFLLEGDLYTPRTRTAMKCLNDAFNCLWPKSSDGKVRIPYIVSEKYGRWRL